MSDNVVLFTGGMDPIHSGHIAVIKEAATLGRVVIGLNSDQWLARKKGKSFMMFDDRKSILSEIKGVMAVIDFDDQDDTAIDAIAKVKKLFPRNKIIFVNGGDRDSTNIPELEYYKNDPSVEFVFGVGGSDKKNSSSWILRNWKSPAENRQWGQFLTYYETDKVKVKRLVIEPDCAISMQYHNHRSELWFIESGSGILTTLDSSNNETAIKQLNTHDYYTVEANTWHKLTNTSDSVLNIIEIQYGIECTESDIVRHG